MKKCFLILLSCFYFLFVQAQNQTNNWHFGKFSGISFNSVPPTGVTGPVNNLEATTTISDLNGNLLFSTDGVHVYDITYNYMQDGAALNGSETTTQTMIIPAPGQCNLYYIFHSNALDHILYYSVVDMTLNNGLGAVTQKNIQLQINCTERVAAVLQSNGTDYWIISQEKGFGITGKFYSYALTSAGVNPVPAVTNIGTPSIANNEVIGYMKVSPDGKKLAYASYMGGVELFNFDNVTGLLSNWGSVNTRPCYGLEFSPDNSKLYAGTIDANSTGNVYQYDLNAGSIGNISASEYIVYPPSAPQPLKLGALQCGPDGRLYISRYESDHLDVIEFPNVAGSGCHFIFDGLSLAKKAQLGLPAFPNKFGPPCGGVAHVITTHTTCGEKNGTAIVQPLFGTAPYTYSIDGTNYQSSNIFSNLAGNNYIVWIRDAAGNTKPVSVLIAPSRKASLNFAVVSNANCGFANGFVNLQPGNGKAPFTYSVDGVIFQTATLFQNLAPGHYTFTIKDADDCKGTASVDIINQYPIINAGPDRDVLVNEPINLSVEDAGHYGFSIFAWSPAAGLSDSTLQFPVCITDHDIEYTITAKTASGCTATDKVWIRVYRDIDIYVPSAFSPNGDGLNDVLRPITRGIASLHYFKIYDRFGQVIFSSDDAAKGWDGTIKGKKQNSSSYVWIAEGIDIKGRTVTKKGTFSLLR